MTNTPPARGAELLETRGLTKVFGSLTACDHVDIAIRKGDIHALLGENGAGKSTLVKMLFGSLEPNEGEIVWKGERVRISRPGIAKSSASAWYSSIFPCSRH